MIEFKIIACPDRSQQATYQHLSPTLTVGNADGDMIIDDPSLSPQQIRISHQSGQFLLENLNPKVEVRLNGKPVQQPTPIKEKDNLNMGRTTINFSRIDLAPLSPPEPYEYPHKGARITEGSKEKAILDALEFQERSETDTAPPPAPGSMPPLPGGVKPPPLPPGAPLPRKP